MNKILSYYWAHPMLSKYAFAGIVLVIGWIGSEIFDSVIIFLVTPFVWLLLVIIIRIMAFAKGWHRPEPAD
jgi:hypothetical protein